MTNSAYLLYLKTKSPLKLFCYFLLFILVFFNTKLYSQKSRIPEIIFSDSLNGSNPSYENLGIKDSEALILKFFEIKGLKAERCSKFIVYYRNGKVRLFKSCETSPLREGTLSKYRVKRKNRQIYWDLLDSLVASKAIYLDKDEILKPPFKIDPNSDPSTLKFVALGRSCLLLFQGNKIMSYCVKEPFVADMVDSPGKEEKLKFFQLYQLLDAVFSNKIKED